MPSLKNKKVLVGVTGGIAAYKIPLLVRSLIKAGAQVKVVMTPMAHSFVTAETLATLSKNPVLTDFFNGPDGEWNNHVDLGLWADAMIVAPAGANALAKMATGICDNLLLTTYLSARCPVFLAPAMDLDMYANEAVQQNIATLKKSGCIIVPPGSGELASGLFGEGRMAEPEELHKALEEHFAASMPLLGKKALVTAGPTHENIDPVRFIGNHSSGKMGYAIADTLAKQGAEVVLVSGPVALTPPEGVMLVPVNSAMQMFDACMDQVKKSDIIVMAAAVADYRPEAPASQKIKKAEDKLLLKLVKNPDILGEMGKNKRKKQWLIGFALETENEKTNAEAKLKNKNLDMLVLNSLRDKGAGFGYDTNKVTILQPGKKAKSLPLKTKTEVAVDIVSAIYTMMNGKKDYI